MTTAKQKRSLLNSQQKASSWHFVWPLSAFSCQALNVQPAQCWRAVNTATCEQLKKWQAHVNFILVCILKYRLHGHANRGHCCNSSCSCISNGFLAGLHCRLTRLLCGCLRGREAEGPLPHDLPERLVKGVMQPLHLQTAQSLKLLSLTYSLCCSFKVLARHRDSVQ